MTQAAPRLVTEGTATVSLVAGLDLLTTRERHADELAQDLAAALTARGGTAVTVATHWARLEEFRHVAVSVECRGLDAGDFFTTLLEAAGDQGDAERFGLIVDDLYAGSADVRDQVAGAVAAHRERASGRVVVFPGSRALTGTLSVGALLGTSAIEQVRILAAGDAELDTLLITRDFVRPRWVDGALVLDTQPAGGDTLVPFETPTPTPCCANHL